MAHIDSAQLDMCLTNLPSCSPDLSADEAIWGWVCREGDKCLRHAEVQARPGAKRRYFVRLSPQ